MADAPYGFALAAGLVAAFNPCGFALLPAYLTLLVAGNGERQPGATATWRALRLSAAMTAGFLTVFGLFGLAAGALAAAFMLYLPWATIVIGSALVGLGIWLLSGRELLLRLPHLRGRGRPETSLGSLYGYGASYAIASLSCTIAPFLAVTAAAFQSGDLAAGIAVFLTYGLGMGLVVGLLSMTVALADAAVAVRLRGLLPYVSRISGVLLVVAGAYVAYYGWYELRIAAGGALDDPLISTATRIQGFMAGWIDRLGPGLIVVAFAACVVFALLVRAGARRRGSDRQS